MDKQLLRIYSFDNTIYNGNSTIDFFLFELKRHNALNLLWPYFIWQLFKLTCGIIAFPRAIENIYKVFRLFKIDVESEAHIFWCKNCLNLKRFYFTQRQDSDIIISASPEALLKPLCEEYGMNLIASNFNTKTGKFEGKICYGEEKLNRVQALGIQFCDEFYTDSMEDAPMIKFAHKAFLVNKDDVQVIWQK